jgi:hypothetical protein
MRANLFRCLGTILITVSFFSCKKETETETIDDYAYKTERLAELIPLQVGKSITYQTDSTIFTNFGRDVEVHSYIERDTIDGMFTDGMGRTSYRITRFLQDLSKSKPAFSNGTYFVTPTSNTVEVNENNFRFVKVTIPVKQDATWKGNLYLRTDPYEDMFKFTNYLNIEMDKWDYAYTNLNDVFNYNGASLTGVVTVTGVNNSNYADTVTVTSSQANLSGKTTVYLRGIAPDKITITANAPTGNVTTLAVYNRTNQAAVLDGIEVPAGQGRTYEYAGGKWTFGSKDQNGNRIDVLYSELPYGTSNLLVEKYAKGIGLVYQELIMWEYQYKMTNNADDGYKTGFAIKRRMINHN